MKQLALVCAVACRRDSYLHVCVRSYSILRSQLISMLPWGGDNVPNVTQSCVTQGAHHEKRGIAQRDKRT